jgi:hypothetical protein
MEPDASTLTESAFRRCATRRKSALFLTVIRGKTTVPEARRTYGVPLAKFEICVDERKQAMQSALGAGPQNRNCGGQRRECPPIKYQS